MGLLKNKINDKCDAQLFLNIHVHVKQLNFDCSII